MGSAAVHTPFMTVRRCSPPLRRPFFFLAMDSGRSVKCSALVSPSETAKNPNKKKSLSRAAIKQSKRVKAVPSSVSSPSSTLPGSTASAELDYNEVAETLENIYKLSPAKVSDRENKDGEDEEEEEEGQNSNLGGMRLVRSKRRKAKRLSFEKRVTLKSAKSERTKSADEDYEDKLLRENYSLGSFSSLDWKRTKIPPVLRSAEHTRLFKLMQPVKEINKLKESLQSDLQREPADPELAAAMNITVRQLRRHTEVGQAARNKLIKHNLRLVLFVINKYFAEFSNSEKFDDLCLAGAKGLITAIDRFEPKRGFRLSTYGLFWIRHSIIRSMTTSSFTRYPFAFESAKHEIRKAKLQLLLDLGRTPTEEEIAKRVGISRERYHDILKATRPIYSLNVKHPVTQEELINGISDIYGAGGDRRRQPALLRLALDDVLDSLKPKESIVIRQRYGLDGKGERSLSEIARNLNISREMVRKHELKAFMKLKHPARLDYLRRYICS